ncbi:terpene cyclase/mutase family protein [bacterium]|nr:terpene cyclase/mutase family protein [bacterium]
MREHTFQDSLREAWSDREIPIWLASTFLHVLLLFGARQITIPPSPLPAEASLRTRLLEIPETPEVEEPEPVVDLPPVESPQEPQDELLAIDVPTNPPLSTEVRDPLEQQVATLSPVDNPASDAISAMLDGENARALAAKGTGGILQGRGKGNKLGLLASQGGSKETEDAVHWGLDWLARHQFPAGHWSLDHTPLSKGPSTGGGRSRSMVAATGMAVLPFLASGYTHKEGPYRQVVSSALKFLIENQQPSGLLQAPGDSALFYSHGLAAIPLCEAYALTKDPNLAAPATAAIRFLLETQNNQGGWRYNVGDGQCDTSVLGWQLMAMKSARLAGIDVPEEAFTRCKAFLETVRAGSDREKFGYINERGKVVIDHLQSTTSIGQLCLQFMGLPQDDVSLGKSVDLMLSKTPNLNTRDCYYWYYATQVIHNVQGPKWDQWNRVMKRVLVSSQNTDEKSTDHGSWDPNKPTPDLWGAQAGGRHMVTCFHILCLEVYYRYLPIYVVENLGAPAPKKKTRPEGPNNRNEKEDKPKESS